MKHCQNCRNYIWGDNETPFPDVCIKCKYIDGPEGKEPSNWKPQPMTNADRIRAMSDNELEAFLIDIDLDKGMPFITDWGKWLQQTAEG